MTFSASTRLNLTSTPTGLRIPVREWDSLAAQTKNKVAQVIGHFQPADLQRLSHFSLLDRTDTKFILHVDTLCQALASLVEQYDVLQVAANRIHGYHNLYFDTSGLHLFTQHHRQQRDRYKVRSRLYDDTGLAYLEVKHKNNLNRTIKTRLPTPELVEELSAGYSRFLEEYYPQDWRLLQPVLWNDFQRITLLSRSTLERLTLDINLGFSDGWDRTGLPGLAVAEVKQDSLTSRSAFMDQMRSLAVQPRRFSKYCHGITLFYSQVKASRFKPRLLLIQQIISQGVHHGSLH